MLTCNLLSGLQRIIQIRKKKHFVSGCFVDVNSLLKFRISEKFKIKVNSGCIDNQPIHQWNTASKCLWATAVERWWHGSCNDCLYSILLTYFLPISTSWTLFKNYILLVYSGFAHHSVTTAYPRCFILP